MFLFYGVLCLAFVFIAFEITLLGARSPKPPFYANETMVAYFVVPGMVGLLVTGLVLCLQSIPSFPPGFVEVALIAAAIGTAVVAHVVLKVKVRIAAFEAAAVKTSAELKAVPGGDAPSNFRKAA